VRVAIAVLRSGMMNPHFGRSKTIAIATVEEGKITQWEEVESDFAHLHPGHHHGPHHAHDHSHGDEEAEDHDHDHDHDHEHEDDEEVQRHRDSAFEFLKRHRIDVVLLDHVGHGMHRAQKEGIRIVLVNPRVGMAREIVEAFARGEIGEIKA